MNNRLVTTIENKILYNILMDEKDQLIEIQPHPLNYSSIVGNIYIGKVSKIARATNAAFINIGLDKDVFLQLDKRKKYIYTNGKASTEPLRPDDELLVQVAKDAYMSKAATVTNKLCLTGIYSVLTYGKSYIGLSTKIKDYDERNRLKTIFKDSSNDLFGFIVRTNAAGIDANVLYQESQILAKQFNKILEYCQYRPSYTCVYKQPKSYISFIRDLYQHEIKEYLFDDEEIFDTCMTYFEHNPAITSKFKYYEDRSYSLFKLLGLRSKIEKSLSEKVWLKSGANLYIQPTEALVVIDVNTSKHSSKGSFQQTIFKINCEAAKEIARQIRLRNLSGIIIVDFIDMKKEDDKQKLVEVFRAYLSMDRIKTTLVDMTPLGLVELTRKKVNKTIYEQFKGLEV